MRTDDIELGSSPSEEQCAQVGAEEYGIRARAEIFTYRAQIERIITARNPNMKRGSAVLKIKSNAHDFGTYLELVVRYDIEDSEAEAFGWWVADNLPTHWDEEARQQLGLEESCTT